MPKKHLMKPKSPKKPKKTIHGQAKPIDTATAVLWKNSKYFAEVFNKIVFKKPFVNADNLGDASEVEATFLQVRKVHRVTLKTTRDVAKALYPSSDKKSAPNSYLMILGIENQYKIDPLMIFRVLESNFINCARQISDIQAKNRDEMKKEEHEGEYISGFKRTDKIKPVITLVIYYGEEEWKGMRHLRDLFEEGEAKYIASDYEMPLLDVRHMDEETLNSFSSDLRAFLGFLRYEKDQNRLPAFMEENEQSFHDLPPMASSALIEITGSSKLKEIAEKFKTETGGVNMIDGIKMYGQQERQAGINETNQRVAVDMLNKKVFTLPIIAEISRLSEDDVRGLAVAHGIQLA